MKLTSKQIKDGFWYHDPKQKFPPDSIIYPEEYQGGERLCISCTQLDLSSYRQKKLVQQWCEILPSLHKVKYIWFSSRVNQELFEAACEMPNLEGLYIKWSSIK